MGLMVFFALGVVLCAALAVSLVARWQLPWREALDYFGLTVTDEDPALRR